MGNNNQGPGIQQQVRINLDDIEPMKCKCGNNVFFKFAQLKHISGFYTPTGQDAGVEMPQYVCANPLCGLMFAGAMHKADIKKLARDPKAHRFNWTEFFVAGMALAGAALKAEGPNVPAPFQPSGRKDEGGKIDG